MKKFEQLDAQVLGLSVDSTWSHKAYAEKMGIQYPLLADFQPRGAVAAKYGKADLGATRALIGQTISIIGSAMARSHGTRITIFPSCPTFRKSRRRWRG